MLGSSGAGKTTLMRAALGLTSLSGGTISVLGQSVKRGNTGIGYMPQSRGSLTSFRLTGYDFVATGVNGTRWGIPRLDASLRREIDWALDMVSAREISVVLLTSSPAESASACYSRRHYWAGRSCYCLTNRSLASTLPTRRP
jgi:ABC-type Mn2+/Zn2+ transport system ATPase subunit